LLLVLYLFIWQLATVIWKDLRRPAAGLSQTARPKGELLVIAAGGTAYHPGHGFPLLSETTIGRAPNNTIVLTDSFVSARHAKLAFRNGEWWLSDLGSKNGTWLNGERIEGEVLLRPGNLLTIGQVTLRLIADG